MQQHDLQSQRLHPTCDVPWGIKYHVGINVFANPERPVGLMDKASASGAGDSRFESWAGQMCCNYTICGVKTKGSLACHKLLCMGMAALHGANTCSYADLALGPRQLSLNHNDGIAKGTHLH